MLKPSTMWPSMGKSQKTTLQNLFMTSTSTLNLSEPGRTEILFRSLVENSGIGVYAVRDDQFLFVNQKMADMMGYEREIMLSELCALDIFAEEEHAAVRQSRQRRLRGDVSETYSQRRGRRSDGSRIDLEIFGSVMNLDGNPVTMCVALDITQRKMDEASARLARLVYETTSEAMVVTDADGHVVHINPAFTRITGFAPHEIVGRKMSFLSSGLHDAEFYDEMWASITRTGTWRGEIWNRRKNGEQFVEQLSINTSYDDTGDVQYRVGLFSDVTKRKKAEAIIWRQAHFDFLTGLPNRKMLADELKKSIGSGDQTGSNVALVFLDLDHFKEVNDVLGHHAGDQLLQEVARRISRSVRRGDIVGRMGGDEFMIIINRASTKEMVEAVCGRVLASLEEPFTIESDQVAVTASLGITLFPDDATDLTELFKNADMAMYAAKGKGRNQLCWFESRMQEKITVRRRLGRELLDALERNEFTLVYQPIVNMRNAQVCKAEALIRWNHPTRGLIGPMEFIPFAEDSGVIDGIGDWVFQEAARQAQAWRAFDPDFQISINVSPAQFVSDGAGHDQWLALLAQLQADGNYSIVVEITEGLLMDPGGMVKQRLRAFRRGGMQIALDDFGTGYSSLSYLKKFDIDYIKIDRSFVSNLGPDTDDRALCDAIIVMAHRLGLKVVAEGIETEDQRRFLSKSGCDYGQGYLFGRPMPPDQFVRLLERRCQPVASK